MKPKTKILTPGFESRREELRMLEIDLDLLKNCFRPLAGSFASKVYYGLLYFTAIAL